MVSRNGNPLTNLEDKSVVADLDWSDKHYASSLQIICKLQDPMNCGKILKDL